jgi:hypothetical protein
MTKAEWLTSAELANRYEIHPSTVRRWYEAGKLHRRENEDGQGFLYSFPTAAEDEPEDEPVAVRLHSEDYYYNESDDVYVTFVKSAPRPVVMSGDDHRALIAQYSNWDGQAATRNEIARKFDLAREWVPGYLRAHSMTKDREPFTVEEVLNENPDELVEVALERKRAALAQKYEKARWKETEKDAAKWRDLKHSVIDALSGFEAAASIPSRGHKTPARGDLVVINPTDQHVGKLGPDYNMEICRERLLDSTSDILRRLPPVDHFVTMLWSDWFHVDGYHNGTTRGTKQDVAALYPEIVRFGLQLKIDFLRMLADRAPVRAFSVPGNHGYNTATALGIALEMLYRDEDVTIVGDPDPRHYYDWGANMIMLAHGDGAKPKDYPTLMAAEQPEMWGRTLYRYAYHGHLHHEVIRGKQHEGATVTQQASLAGKDWWHLHNGYISDPALSAYVHDKDRGRVAQFTSQPF